MWVPIAIPDIPRPIRGFTFPRGNILLVLCSGGLVEVELADPAAIRFVADPQQLQAMYGPGKERLVWEGTPHLVYDADGGDITLCDHPNGDRIVMGDDGALWIMDPEERELRQSIESIRLPAGDSWMFAGFSRDFQWLVACDPERLQVFRETS